MSVYEILNTVNLENIAIFLMQIMWLRDIAILRTRILVSSIYPFAAFSEIEVINLELLSNLHQLPKWIALSKLERQICKVYNYWTSNEMGNVNYKIISLTTFLYISTKMLNVAVLKEVIKIIVPSC